VLLHRLDPFCGGSTEVSEGESLRYLSRNKEKEAYETIFLPFKRGETSKTVEGTGLGSAIVRAIADRHRGSVWAESGLEEGIAFSISESKHL